MAMSSLRKGLDSTKQGLVEHNLDEHIVQPIDLEYGEFVFRTKMILSYKPLKLNPKPLKLKPKPLKYKSDKNLIVIISALLNTSGGVILLLSPNGDKQLDAELFDKWRNDVRAECNFMPDHIFQDCISLKQLKDDAWVMLVLKSSQFVTTKTNLCRRTTTAETIRLRTCAEIQNLLNHDAIHEDPTHLDLEHSYKYEEEVPFPESKHIEFKSYRSAKNPDDLIKQIIENRAISTMLAFANSHGGGDIIFGIKEEGSKKVCYGQEILENDEKTFQEKLEKLLEEHNGIKRVWGDPEKNPSFGELWTCQFIPVLNPGDTTRRRIIRIHVNYFKGGVFEAEPEAFFVNDSGFICRVPFSEWRKIYEKEDAASRFSDQSARVRSAEDGQEALDSPDNIGAEESFPTTSRESARNEEYATVVVSSDNVIYGDGLRLSFSKHSSHVSLNTDQTLQPALSSDMFSPAYPVNYTPAREIIEENLNKTLLAKIDEEMEGEQAFGLASETMFSCIEHPFNAQHCNRPPFHLLDLIIMNKMVSLFLFVICQQFGNERQQDQQKRYAMVLARVLKKRALEQICSAKKEMFKLVHIRCKVVLLNGTPSLCTPKYYHEWMRSDVDYASTFLYMRTVLATVASKVPSHFRDSIVGGSDWKVSEEQHNVLLSIHHSKFNFIEGPPGCGKTLLAQNVCEQRGKNRSAYISASRPLNNRINVSGKADAHYATTTRDIMDLVGGKLNEKMYIVIDDNHNLEHTEAECEELCAFIAEEPERRLYVFQDSVYQNYLQEEDDMVLERVVFKHRLKYGSFLFKIMTEIRRNKQRVGSYIVAHTADLTIPRTTEVKCHSNVQGDDVEILHVPYLREKTDKNGLLKHVNSLLKCETMGAREMFYAPKDIAILCDDTSDVNLLFDIFTTSDYTVHKADTFPIGGIIIDELKHFSGLESRVVLFVIPESGGIEGAQNNLMNPKYRIAIASRAVDRADFLQGDNIKHSYSKMMKIDRPPSSAVKYTDSDKTKLDYPETDSIDITKDGKLVVCNSEEGVVSCPARGGLPVEYLRLAVKDQRPWSVSIHRSSGDIVVGYENGFTHDIHTVTYSSESKVWSAPHEVGKGKYPRVTWTKSAKVVLSCRAKDGKHWNVYVDKVKWPKSALAKMHISDIFVGMDNNIYCCAPLNDRIAVFDQNGKTLKTLMMKHPERQFARPISACLDHENHLLVLHREYVSGNKEQGTITRWDLKGQFLREVVSGLPDPDWQSTLIRLHDRTLFLAQDRIVKKFNLSIYQ